MPFLGPDDPLPNPPRRIIVIGAPGAGKTTLARRLGELLAIPHIEIDALFHGPNWAPRPTFLAEVQAFSSGPAWITEWQYDTARPLLADRAELAVWLDLPRRRVMRQVVVRTLRRRIGRQLLWNVNIEPPLRTIFTDPEHIVRWAWTTHQKVADRVGQLTRQHPELPVVRLTSRVDIDRWLNGPLGR